MLTFCCLSQIHAQVEQVPEQKNNNYSIVLHGGAGMLRPEHLSVEMLEKYKSALNEALSIGENILKDGGTSISAVTETIKFLENSPLFNAGKGAVFTHYGTNELDASIMDGKTQNAGAVGGVTNVKNPITAALAVMDKSDHVFMVGKGAESFAIDQGLEIVDPHYFFTEQNYNRLKNARDSEKRKMSSDEEEMEKKKGTVGCVALDSEGNIAAGTSTGGMTNKKYNRIGDSPVIGAGTYANNASCGVSCTGHGEYFIRFTIARDIAAMMEYGGKSLEKSAHYLVKDKLVDKGGLGGIIAIDKDGNISMPFNTTCMFRAWSKNGEKGVAVF